MSADQGISAVYTVPPVLHGNSSAPAPRATTGDNVLPDYPAEDGASRNVLQSRVVRSEIELVGMRMGWREAMVAKGWPHSVSQLSVRHRCWARRLARS